MSKRERGLHELYAVDPERADLLVFGRIAKPNRRGFLHGAGLAAMSAAVGAAIPFHDRMPAGLIPVALAQDTDLVIEGKEGLILRNDRPLNMETPPHLLDDEVTPNHLHFVRNNGTLPEPIDPAEWRLKIDGEVETELELGLEELTREFEPVTLRLQLECGGNGRAGFEPSPRGNQWEIGAVGCADGLWPTCSIAPGSGRRRSTPATTATTSISRASRAVTRSRAAGRSPR